MNSIEKKQSTINIGANQVVLCYTLGKVELGFMNIF